MEVSHDGSNHRSGLVVVYIQNVIIGCSDGLW